MFDKTTQPYHTRVGTKLPSLQRKAEVQLRGLSHFPDDLDVVRPPPPQKGQAVG